MESYYYRSKADSVDSSSNSTRSAGTDRSSQTISSPPASIPSLERRDSTTSPAESELFEFPRVSADTYCTTVASLEEYEPEEPVHNYYNYNYRPKTFRPTATPATPTEFAALFPTTNQIKIRHDDASPDGDMNVRVDRVVPGRYGQDKTITLFHLRMYDLEKREFSLRRYGRDCGREVAHTHAKVDKPPTPKRPALQRSVSKAFHSFKGKCEHEKQIGLHRQDSGYGSAEDEDDVFQDKPHEDTKSTNTVVLEFSNYAHVQLTRKGSKTSRKYDFEYWGKNYSWRRYVNRSPVTGEEEVSFQLFNNASPHAVAIIKPDNPTFPSTQGENGEFVPPCSFYMKDTPSDPIRGAADVADAIMATGLMALVDDCIKRKFSKKKIVQLAIPLPMRTPLKMNMEYVGPKRLIDEVFNRTRPGMQARSLSSPTPSPTSSPSRRR